MPRAPRTSLEVETEKTRILYEALKIITEYGYEGLTMRRLGSRLGMAAKTIYNYFTNKDEIYLHVLTKGFELLYEEVLIGYNSSDDPFEQLKAMTKAFINYGLSKSNYYDIMLTWYVPKYNDFVGSPLEEIAYHEMMTAFKTRDLLIQVVEKIGDTYGGYDRKQARILFVKWLTGIHGIIALYNNTILDYVHDSPAEILETVAEKHLSFFAPKKKTLAKKQE